MSDAPEAASEQGAPEAAPEPELVHGVPVTHSLGAIVLHPAREELVQLVRSLRTDGWFQCMDLCAVDYLTHTNRPPVPVGIELERYEVVLQLLNHRERSRVRLRVQVPADEPTCPSLFSLHPGVEAPEREAFDLFGIRFDGHPDLTRILLPDEWEGHPLRKDHTIGRIPVQFKGTTSDAPATPVHITAAPRGPR